MNHHVWLGLTQAGLAVDARYQQRPPGAQIEPVELDLVEHFASDRQDRHDVPAPRDAASERTARRGAIDLGLRGLSQQPTHEHVEIMPVRQIRSLADR